MIIFKVRVSAIGNHEFDHGVVRAFELFRQSEGKIKWLCSNLKLKDTAKPFLEKAGGDVTIHDTVVEIIDGKKIGMFPHFGV